jgi:hypothetical protein
MVMVEAMWDIYCCRFYGKMNTTCLSLKPYYEENITIAAIGLLYNDCYNTCTGQKAGYAAHTNNTCY